MSIIASLFIGGIAGWLSGNIMKGKGFGLIGNIVVGIVGAIIGGFTFGLAGFYADSIIGSIITSTVGACLLLYLIRILTKP
ncbi:GlsB/YeaQ/YmgE family stress response membrane protein [Marinicellulosiphila megalodicopiae]|uniref:GlsB/YeaQ/YmgE family stress response membrane protein n=1 Tax=Marinicellulosiphila megalodicopiae TaxID=2724896 RepID=UPI003BB0ED10